MNIFFLAVPTLNPKDAEGFIEALNSQSVRPLTLLILDSHSNDHTRNLFERYGAEILMIEPMEFDHGSTRQLAVDHCYQRAEIVVFITQDAFLADKQSLERLLSAFDDDNVGAAYGRQLPRKDANPVEAHARNFNYPPESQTKSLADSKKLGIKTCFVSNSFAAYRVSTLQQIGGFPAKNIVSEDTYVAAKILEAGWHIKYCADATVYHSHNYSILEEFQRYFDLGVFHSREPWIRERFGQAEGEGQRFVKSQISYLKKDHIHLIPLVLLRTVFKYLGFRLGFCEAYLPNRLKMWLSMQKNFWM
jgi:rhamnosyltransferase